MIAAVEGVLEARLAEGAVVRVGGVSLLVQAPLSTLARLGPEGSQVKLFTHLHVREDALSLFGFQSRDELRAFQLLITVSGVGPKLALTVLSNLSLEALQIAIASGNVDALTGIPGIGKRTAGRIALELRGKMGPTTAGGPILPSAASEELVAALSGLGYNAAQIQVALTAVPPDPALSLEDKIVLALRTLSPH
ncbi:MAG: Holliday junction branch migration protein RuvA [Chloroflexi bacterium]|nr:Holliday junction branch migration protein RuvA [Chloroflexota bacterium]MCL5108877.1 Holliday junction branch migration protein RuvA [Chloroflexota bacterium]